MGRGTSRSTKGQSKGPRPAFTSPPPSPSKILAAQILLSKANLDKKSSSTKKKTKQPGPLEVEVGDAPDSTRQRNPPLVEWSKPEFSYLTDNLLTFIEDKATWKVAFGFDRGADQDVKNGGKKLVEHHRDIAKRLLMEDQRTGIWKETSLVKLGDSVKNRINVLKKSYGKHRTDLGMTGQGLLDGGRMDEIMAGSELANIWAGIRKLFPWFERMHILMGTSPIMDRSAVAHSSSEIDLSELEQKARGVSEGSENELLDIDDDAECSDTDTPRRSTSPGAASGGNASGSEEASAPQKVPLPPTKKMPASAKRKSARLIADLREFSNESREAKRRALEYAEKEKSHRRLTQERMRQEHLTSIERMRLDSQTHERALDRQHEMHLMDKKIELLRLQVQLSAGAGGSTMGIHASFNPPTLPGSGDFGSFGLTDDLMLPPTGMGAAAPSEDWSEGSSRLRDVV